MVNKGAKKMHFSRPQLSRSQSQDYHGHHEFINAAGKPVIAGRKCHVAAGQKSCLPGFDVTSELTHCHTYVT